MAKHLLKLTGLICRADTPGVFIGCLLEIGGVHSQANAVVEVERELWEHTPSMLPYKLAEVARLLGVAADNLNLADVEIRISVETLPFIEAVARVQAFRPMPPRPPRA